MFSMKEYSAEVSSSGVISVLYRNGNKGKINLSAKGLGAVCLSATDHRPRFLQRYQDGIQPTDIPLKEFVTVQDFTPKCHSVSFNDNRITAQYEKYNTTVQYTFESDAICIHAAAQDERIIQFGLAFSLNYPGTDAVRKFHQLMPSSPYTSSNMDICFFLMPMMDGDFLLITAENKIDGWKLDYSEYNYGHFILNMKMLEQFDACYKPPHSTFAHEMTLWVDFPASLEDALSCVQRRAKCSCAVFPISGGTIGTSIPMRIYGNCEKVAICSPSGTEQPLEVHNGFATAVLSEIGMHRVKLQSLEGKLYDFNLFGYESLQDLWLRSIRATRKPYHCDENLAEGGVWCWSMLCYMRNYGVNNQILSSVTDFLQHKLLTTDSKCATPHCTLWPFPQEINGHKYGSWHIWQSTRIQEQFFGVSILLEAYHVFHREELLECAIQVATNLLLDHISSDGQIFRLDDAGNHVDYTTVCAPVIALVDLTRELQLRNDIRANHWKNVCEQIADYLLNRGFSFPTEADQAYADLEIEDGSISCTALSVLYVCYWICHKSEYIDFAKHLLKFHDAWICYTQDVRMYRSTFRWWELIWEGDQDGPAICAGHAWTIWRAEADYYLAMLTGDSQCAKNSYCGYLTNYCKVEHDGNMGAAFVADLLPYRASEGSLGHRYPKKKDYSLSRYVWTRSVETWLTAGGIFASDSHIETIHMRYTQKEYSIFLAPTIPKLSTLFADASDYAIQVKTVHPLRLVSSQPITVTHGNLQSSNEHISFVIPSDGYVEFRCYTNQNKIQR